MSTGETQRVWDAYKVLIDTRNLEINLFWQRSNYFLVLNTGLAIGFFNIKEDWYRWARWQVSVSGFDPVASGFARSKALASTMGTETAGF
ncbi:MAG TPA: hypothetical protein VIJ01_18425 [Candidatus Angelobacter sp.]